MHLVEDVDQTVEVPFVPKMLTVVSKLEHPRSVDIEPWHATLDVHLIHLFFR